MARYVTDGCRKREREVLFNVAVSCLDYVLSVTDKCSWIADLWWYVFIDQIIFYNQGKDI
jgi:hypothetical protein